MHRPGRVVIIHYHQAYSVTI